VYYAHLASNRARAHESMPASEGPRGGQKFVEQQAHAIVAAYNAGDKTPSSVKPPIGAEASPLVGFGAALDEADAQRVSIYNSMWYI
jgi:eukaryotic translation initiation factor 2C